MAPFYISHTYNSFYVIELFRDYTKTQKILNHGSIRFFILRLHSGFRITHHERGDKSQVSSTHGEWHEVRTEPRYASAFVKTSVFAYPGRLPMLRVKLRRAQPSLRIKLRRAQPARQAMADRSTDRSLLRCRPHEWMHSCKANINSVRGECRAQRGVSNHEQEKEMCKLRIDRVPNHTNGFCLSRK